MPDSGLTGYPSRPPEAALMTRRQERQEGRE